MLVVGYSVCNPATLTDVQRGTNSKLYSAQSMVIGLDGWGCFVDFGNTGHAFTAIFGSLEKVAVPFGSQFILVDVSSPLFFQTPFLPGPLAFYNMPIPNDPGLCGMTVYSQAFLVGGGLPATLSNGQAL